MSTCISSRRFVFAMLSCMVVAYWLCACSGPVVNLAPAPTATPLYTLAGGGGCVRLGNHAKAASYANIQVSHDGYLAHSEPMLVEDPANPLHLVGGSKFFTDPARYRFQIGYFVSFDGGCMWMDGGVIQGFEKNILTSDPSFAFGPDNRVYAAFLYAAVGERGVSGIAVSTSADGGKTFGAPVTVFEDKTGNPFSDKPWMVVDQTKGPHRGAIYIAWSYDHGQDCGVGNFCHGDLAFSRSTDGGRSFSAVQLVEGSAPFCTNPARGKPAGSTLCDAVQGVIPVVEPDGTVVIATPYIDLMGGRIPTRLMALTSEDGGETWTQPVLIATIHDVAGFFRPERYRNVSLPAFACDPRSGQLYIAWADKETGDADILFATSRDKGKTWSPPIRVNDDPVQDGAHQFQPQMVVAPNGVVSISFFDTRVDAQHRLIDVYLAQSIDRGVSFLKNERVTTRSWDSEVDAPVDGYGDQFIGDYQGLAGDNAFVHPFWNDTRTGRQEIFTAAIPSEQPK